MFSANIWHLRVVARHISIIIMIVTREASKNHTVDCRGVQRPITFSRTSLDASHLSNPARASHGKDTYLWNWIVRLYLWTPRTPSTEHSTIILTHMHTSRYLAAWKPFPTTFSSVYIVWNKPITSILSQTWMVNPVQLNIISLVPPCDTQYRWEVSQLMSFLKASCFNYLLSTSLEH